MFTPEIVSYIKTERAKGTPDAAIKASLAANGWNEADITEATAQAALPTTDPNMPASQANNPASVPFVPTEAGKAQAKKAMWTTFFTLIGADALIIILMKAFVGQYGVFGIGIVAVVVRLLVIYVYSYFTTRPLPKAEKKYEPPRTLGQKILKGIGTAILFILIAAGIVFVGCLFLLGGASGL